VTRSGSATRRTTADGIQRVVAATVERFGGVDVLVNNSGGPAPGKLPSLTDDDWRRGFEVVTLNFVRFVREVVPQSNGIRPGVAGLMKAVMPELARDGITINLVLPGIVLTDRIRHSPAGPGGADDATIQAHVTAGIPLGRLGEPAEVGQLVAFLSSEQAGYITGAVYQIDGGIIRSNL
jgi:3-oxoacyl-[acyl-carrier protein] reductase